MATTTEYIALRVITRLNGKNYERGDTVTGLSADQETALLTKGAIAIDGGDVVPTGQFGLDVPYIKAINDKLDAQNGKLDLISVNTDNQVDYVKLLQEHNEVATTLYAKVIGDRNIEVMVPFKGKKAAHYAVRKDVLDDFMKFQDGAVSTVEVIPSYTQTKNYDAETGTWSKIVNNQNWFATQVGATFSFAFVGTGFDFRHYADNRGGIWEFVVDGNTSNKVTVSTYNPTPISVTVKQIKRGLTKGTHNVVATFKGDDPANPPSSGTGTARGWVRNSSNLTDPTAVNERTNKTVDVYDDLLNPTKVFDILVPSSNKEFAITVAPTGVNTGYFVPDHGTGTAFAVEQKIYFDDLLISDWTPDTTVRPVKNVKVIQKMQAKYPDDTNPLAEIYCVHSITARGVSYKVKFNWLRSVHINTGYVNMFPFFNSFGKKLLTSYGTIYDATAISGSTDLAENDKAVSYAVLNDGTGIKGEPDTVVAMTVQNIEKSFRYGKADRGRTAQGNPIVWLEHRDATMHKLYPNVYINSDVNAGDTHEIGATFFIGEMPYASKILI